MAEKLALIQAANADQTQVEDEVVDWCPRLIHQS